MKKRLTFITLLMLFCTTMFGQSHWGNPVGTDMSMTMYGNILLNGEQVKRDNVQIGAFCNGELRGYTTPDASADYIFVLDIAGRKNNETIEFRLYDPEYEGTVELIDDIKLDHVVTFRSKDAISMNINFTPSYWNKYELLPVIEEYEHITMAVIAYIYINGEYQNRNDIELAAYCGEELRSIVRPILNKNTQQYIANFNIYGQDEDEITFKLYDHSGNILSELLPLSSDYSVIFEDGKIDGYPTPINLDFVCPIVSIKETEQHYYTLAAAVEAAEANQTVVLRRDATGAGVVIDKEVTIDFAGFAYTLNEGEVISIQEGGVATFLNDANITEGVELFGGQLFTSNNNLTLVAKKAFDKVSGIVGATDGWGTISTPVGTVAIPEGENHDLYMYEEATAMWRFYTGEDAAQPFTEFTPGEGYLYANTSDVTIELKGTLNVMPLTRKLGYTEEMEALAGFNFVGNPFAHNISEANFSTTDDALLSNGFYVISAEGAIVARPENAVIAPMESVMVQTDKATELTINRFENRSSEVNNGSLEIRVANNNYSDLAYVSFSEGKGLSKLAHRNAEIPMVYIPVDGVNYAIATMSKDVTEIPVSFVAATMGEYTISVETRDCEYTTLILIDRFTGIETNLLFEDYTFIATSNDNADRFIIKMENTQLSINDENNFVFISNGMMIINNIEGQGTVSVYDITGRPVAEYNVATSANISTAEFATGVYIIRMINENGVKVQKIVVE